MVYKTYIYIYTRTYDILQWYVRHIYIYTRTYNILQWYIHLYILCIILQMCFFWAFGNDHVLPGPVMKFLIIVVAKPAHRMIVSTGRRWGDRSRLCVFHWGSLSLVTWDFLELKWRSLFWFRHLLRYSYDELLWFLMAPMPQLLSSSILTRAHMTCFISTIYTWFFHSQSVLLQQKLSNSLVFWAGL